MIVKPVEYKHRIYGYVRVSTQEQCRSGVSIDQQKQLITNFSINKYNRAIDQWLLMMASRERLTSWSVRPLGI